MYPAVLYEGKYHGRFSLKSELIAETNIKLDWDRAEVTIIYRPHVHKDTAMDKEIGYSYFLILEGKPSLGVADRME